MHEALAYYEADTHVVDEPSPIARPRTVTDGAMTMQVLLDGEHHRRTPDLAMTACEKPIPSQFSPLRRETLTNRDGKLCAVCFTPYERRKAAENDRKDIDP